MLSPERILPRGWARVRDSATFSRSEGDALTTLLAVATCCQWKHSAKLERGWVLKSEDSFAPPEGRAGLR